VALALARTLLLLSEHPFRGEETPSVEQKTNGGRARSLIVWVVLAFYLPPSRQVATHFLPCPTEHGHLRTHCIADLSCSSHWSYILSVTFDFNRHLFRISGQKKCQSMLSG